MIEVSPSDESESFSVGFTMTESTSVLRLVKRQSEEYQVAKFMSYLPKQGPGWLTISYNKSVGISLKWKESGRRGQVSEHTCGPTASVTLSAISRRKTDKATSWSEMWVV